MSSPPSNQQNEGRRRSSFYNSFQEVLNAGGKNSINNFASSYSRSANFLNADFDYSQRPSKLTLGTSDDAQLDEESALIDEDSPSTYTGVDDDHLDPNQPLHQHQHNYGAIMDEENISIREEVLLKSGNSTAPQTIFNGINTLIGIGILTLPLGLHYAGWILGSIILLSCAISSQITAKILSECLKKNPKMKTYGDIAQYSYGRIAYLVVVSTFTIDLLFAGISMIILFADSFNVLTGIKTVYFKILISIMFFLLSFVNLSILSSLSLVGIICTSLIVCVVFFCGFIKAHAPGSLLEISSTSLWPMDLKHLLLSLGIFMSPFGGHAIFPELYKDMKSPQKYKKSCNVIFSFTWFVDYVMASLGYLMFGQIITDQVTKSIMLTEGYPKWIGLVICTLMGLLPISKGPLITRPIITMTDQLTLDLSLHPKKSNHEFVIKFINRFVVTLIFLITSLIFTDFGRIMSFLGSAICFSICIIYPLAFYLKLYHDELSNLQKTISYIGIIIALIFAVSGTIAVVFA
ncbi:Vesicular inhibitory amino acid transporter [Wickerhamomyces ciferrii]|uniref:Vesicular inhibitory amino acid transporter n=1 Tax=Wickerhamomyces ciferrii (strain ATCC 14091 / BCRC 22168 / CBS 111 / JCM 3599 / NBRC 0793 / NRRL Y-1031 F-60-10) TaxID=1206466 RepID=K0KQF8_WICCF|nr:Vesicular inhibitory amino acid transporter [Wickerhamomyces ciferrii]CCH43488.1 Vesicular inhibitory amino acid transporter [Wickerhamomyces ciferrii]